VLEGRVGSVVNSEGHHFIPRAEVLRLKELRRHAQREAYRRILEKDIQEERADRGAGG
jgi:hypothetical protein